MKYTILLFCIVAYFATTNAKSCDSSMDCGINECCKDLGLINQCKSLRSVGETCLGKFLCGCKLGYVCKEREESIWNSFKVGEGICTSYANMDWKK